MKVIYKKISDNELQAFGMWQQLSKSERRIAKAESTIAFLSMSENKMAGWFAKNPTFGATDEIARERNKRH